MTSGAKVSVATNSVAVIAQTQLHNWSAEDIMAEVDRRIKNSCKIEMPQRNNKISNIA